MIQKAHFTLEGAAGKTIFGDYMYDDQLTILGTIIFVHGFKGFKDWGAHNQVAAFFASNGYRYYKFNLSHSGVSAESPNDVTDMETFAANTVSKELYDLDQVVNYVMTHSESPLTLIGHSRGGGLVILKAAKDNRIANLVTWSSISDFHSLWKKEQEEEWLSTGRIHVVNARTKEKMPLNSTLLNDINQHQEAYDILKAAQQVEVPWLILHGDDDVNVDFGIAQQLAQKQLNAKIQKIAGANHVYGASHPYVAESLPPHLQEVVEKTLDFIQLR